jgi:hypothetical protein
MARHEADIGDLHPMSVVTPFSTNTRRSTSPLAFL